MYKIYRQERLTHERARGTDRLIRMLDRQTRKHARRTDGQTNTIVLSGQTDSQTQACYTDRQDSLTNTSVLEG
jgi:hypothetical protein